MMRTYSELISYPTYDERVRYLSLSSTVGAETFGFDRIFNQKFYQSKEWQKIRNYVIMRDNGCDLGLPGLEIPKCLVIHHMNPISINDIRDGTDILLNPEYLITVSHNTHNLIHYGYSRELDISPVVERKLNDTCPWKGGTNGFDSKLC